MNLQSTISVYAGGPGSGCNPEAGKCGRHGKTQLIYHGTAVAAAAKILQNGLKRSSTGQQHIPVVYTTPSKAAALSFAWGAAKGIGPFRGRTRNAKEAALVVLKSGVTSLPHFEDQIVAFPPGTKEIDFKEDIPKKYVDRVEIYNLDDIDLETAHTASWMENIKPSRVIHAGKKQPGETYLVILTDGHNGN